MNSPPEALNGLPVMIQAGADRSPQAACAALAELPLARTLMERGALLLRGFDLADAPSFEQVALAVSPRLQRDYLGTSPREPMPGARYIFSASELPHYYPIQQHAEMSFVAKPPELLMFACFVAPQGGGGETPIVDLRRVWADLNPGVRERLDKRGVRIYRNYSPGKDLWQLKPWTELFGTQDKAVVSARCEEQGFAPEWFGDRLRLTHSQPASRPHPLDGAPVFYNHAAVFHLGSAASEYRRIVARQGWSWAGWWAVAWLGSALKSRRPAEDQAMQVVYGDGQAMPQADIEAILDAIWKNLVCVPWQKGDVVIIDNRWVGHGRMPYRGPRVVAVAWGDAPR